MTVARANPLLETILTRAAGGGDISLLSLVHRPRRSAPETAFTLVRDWVGGQWPAADPPTSA